VCAKNIKPSFPTVRTLAARQRKIVHQGRNVWITLVYVKII
jgi:hypothetical protein